ncbi:MAG TPA: DNRLRE domain-containing protein [Phycisphaerae bacterium]|nr:DNRLRE domain-containing protein [Phycisphaerae bacterium]
MFRPAPIRAPSPVSVLVATIFGAVVPSISSAHGLIAADLFSPSTSLGRQAVASATLAPSMDNTLYDDAEGDASNGGGSAMFAGRNSASTYSARRALLAFDVSAAIPTGSTIESVTLTLFNDAANTSPQVISLHRIDQSWGEGTTIAGGGQGSGAPAAPGDATWTHRLYGSDLWTTPGGDFAPTASTFAIVAEEGFYSWPSTASLVADVQSFLDNPSGNFGWILLGNENEASSSKRFATREAADPALRPILTIEFVPEPSCVGWLFVLLLVRSRRPQRRLIRRNASCPLNSPVTRSSHVGSG